MFFGKYEIKTSDNSIKKGTCNDCIFWDSVEQEAGFRACLLRVYGGKITMLCRKSDTCKSFKKKKTLPV